MYSPEELHKFLPFACKENLSSAIGQSLIEVERFFGKNLMSYLKPQPPYDETSNLFSTAFGATQFFFSNGLVHSFGIEPGWFSILLLPEPFSNNPLRKVHKLSEAGDLASPNIKECLGKICQDVRIWRFKDEFESDIPNEAGVSYLLSNGSELFYCAWIHDRGDSASLILKQDIHLDKVASCFSLLVEDFIDPAS